MTLRFILSAPMRSWENLLGFLVLVSVLYSVLHLWFFSYLPAPFFYEPSDTYADWLNTAYWARDAGTYDLWQTLYPPLSFVFLRLTTLDRCYSAPRAYDYSPGLAARDCDWLGISFIWFFYLLNAYLAYRVFKRVDRETAVVRTICLSLGWPMLDAVERGNLVIVAFTCFVLAFAPLLKSARGRAIAAGLAINFKVYLIAALLPLILKRRWLFVEMALISTVIIYLLSYAVLGRGTLTEIYANLANWSSMGSANPLDLWVSTTYKGFIKLLQSDDFPVLLIIGSRNSDILLTVLPALITFSQGLIILAAAAIWVRPEAVSSMRTILLGTMLALITSESGAYTPIYWTFLILLEPWRGFARKYSIVLCYVLAISYDFPLAQVLPKAADTYFRGEQVLVDIYITVMPYFRPLMILTVAWAMAALTIKEVWTDIRTQGWKQRWRFRSDAPIMVGQGQAMPPRHA